MKEALKKQKQHVRNAPRPIVLAVVPVLAGIVMVASAIAANTLSFEAESGVLAGGASIMSDTAASGGNALAFAPTSGDPYATIDTPNFQQVRATWTSNQSVNWPVHDSSGEPSGNFRTFCYHSHFAYDDPIVYPGQQGVAHLHNFYGNVSANYASTYNLLRTVGNSTCQGGPLNRTGYWVPAMHNASGRVVVPWQVELYYKGNGSRAEIQGIQNNPNGLRMIAGFDMARSVPAYERVTWYCNGQARSQVLEGWNCPNGSELMADLRFPMCWDGQNLDSSNHRSHMAYGASNNGGWITGSVGCQAAHASHPIHLPELTLKVRYTADGNTGNWYLSSDRMPGMTHRNGETWHADWFGAWDPIIQETWTQKCIRELKSCVWGELGDGTRLIDPPNAYNGPWIVDPPARP